MSTVVKTNIEEALDTELPSHVHIWEQTKTGWTTLCGTIAGPSAGHAKCGPPWPSIAIKKGSYCPKCFRPICQLCGRSEEKGGRAVKSAGERIARIGTRKRVSQAKLARGSGISAASASIYKGNEDGGAIASSKRPAFSTK